MNADDGRATATSERPTVAAARRGTLRIYLGAAPGVGKTFAMLGEGRRRQERGADVVVGLVETHGRQRTLEQIADLEVVPRRSFEYRGTTLEEMDVDAILVRRPEVVLVDEYAHTNVPGSRNAKRWQDVGELLDAGIDVISTVNIQHLESLNDVVERITGIHQRETVPDHAVRAAEQIELVDMSPEALRRRMAHGNIYAADKIDTSLTNYFREGNLSALRELALLWVADRVDDALEGYRERHGITKPWETRERVLVALTGSPAGDRLIRRAARIAQRAKGVLIGVHVHQDTGLAGDHGDISAALAEHKVLLLELGGEFREVTSNDVAAALTDVARQENATQIVLGASNRSRWQELLNGSVINRVIRRSGDVDVHVISTEAERPAAAATRKLPAVRVPLTPLSPRRQFWGLAITAVGLPGLALLFANMRDTFGLETVLLLYLALGMVVALVGGMLPAAVAVLGGFLVANWYFTPPYYRFSIAEAEHVLALMVYLLSAGIVAALVDRLGRSRLEATRSKAEAESMASLAGALASQDALHELVGHLRETFGFQIVALFREEHGAWQREAVAGAGRPDSPEGADTVKHIGEQVTLAMWGGDLSTADERILNALASQLALAAESRRLHGEASRAAALAEANDLRAALLQAVSHDLRTPLASIKASISSLRQRDVVWSSHDVEEFQRTIEEETDRLSGLVANLLDMSRLQAGVLPVDNRPVGVEEVVLAAVRSLGAAGQQVQVEVPETLHDIHADAALLERALANLISNAVRVSPAGKPVRICAGHAAGHTDIRVVDHGPGIPVKARDLVFEPFQRLVDHGSGVGLGLAIARGFVEAIGGDLAIDDTPGGGVTMVVTVHDGPA